MPLPFACVDCLRLQSLWWVSLVCHVRDYRLIPADSPTPIGALARQHLIQQLTDGALCFKDRIAMIHSPG